MDLGSHRALHQQRSMSHAVLANDYLLVLVSFEHGSQGRCDMLARIQVLQGGQLTPAGKTRSLPSAGTKDRRVERIFICTSRPLWVTCSS